MKTILLFLICAPLLSMAQLKPNEIPGNTIALNDSLFIGQTEITNRMYREFVHYVQDSLFTVLLYDSLPFNRAKELLQVPENRLKNLVVDKRSEYAKIYGLNFNNYRKFINKDTVYFKTAERFYLPNAERYYQRREINSNTLVYKSNSGDFIPVYPDTLSWINDYYVKYDPIDSVTSSFAFVNSYYNAYFWHPAYDNYPVVGLNQAQMLAYCEWYAKQLNVYKKHNEITYTVSLPTVQDYELAMKKCVPSYVQDLVLHDQAFNMIVYTRDEKYAEEHVHPAYTNTRTFGKNAQLQSRFVMNEWIKTNATSPILNLLGGPAEMVLNPKEPDFATVLGGDYYLGLVDPNGIQANTLFYQRLLYKNVGYSFVSFRILVTVTEM